MPFIACHSLLSVSHVETFDDVSSVSLYNNDEIHDDTLKYDENNAVHFYPHSPFLHDQSCQPFQNDQHDSGTENCELHASTSYVPSIPIERRSGISFLVEHYRNEIQSRIIKYRNEKGSGLCRSPALYLYPYSY